MQRPRVSAPAPVDNSSIDALTAQVAEQSAATAASAALPARALPPAVMQDSPWAAGGKGKASAGKSGAAGTVLTAPGGLVPATDTSMRGKTLLGS